MNKHTEKTFETFEQPLSAVDETKNEGMNEVTKLQDDAETKSDNDSENDKMSDGTVEVETKQEPSWEEKYAALNDSHLRLSAEFDNFRKRTIREKADLIKTGGATVLANILPVIDDFERALDTLQSTDDRSSTVEGVKLIYDKFINYLSQQGVKKIDAIDQPFNTDLFEAIATFPIPEEDRKGKVIDCIQTGYMLFDKVLRHAKVVVGE